MKLNDVKQILLHYQAGLLTENECIRLLKVLVLEGPDVSNAKDHG